jgi:hypothetical protein
MVGTWAVSGEFPGAPPLWFPRWHVRLDRSAATGRAPAILGPGSRVSALFPRHPGANTLNLISASLLTQQKDCPLIRSRQDRICPRLNSPSATMSGTRRGRGWFSGSRLPGRKIRNGTVKDDVLVRGAVSRVVKEWTRRPASICFAGTPITSTKRGATTSNYETRDFNLETFKGFRHICQPRPSGTARS